MKRLIISLLNVSFLIVSLSAITSAQIQSGVKQNITAAVYNKIVFSRQESQTDWDIWMMDLNGNNQTRLLNSTSNDGDPHFRFDGAKIVFGRFTQGTPPTQDIYVMDSDGSNMTNLTGTFQNDAARPKWSWDGTKIVMRVTVGPEDNDIYIMNADGSNKTALITGSNNDEWPSFSPDGQYIVFQRYIGSVQNQKTKICRYKISDGTITELTDGSNLDEMPCYSPDGQSIIFKRGTSNTEIYKLTLASMALINLTNSASIDDAPMYSYDGSKIAWMVSTSGMNTAEIWIMNSDGSNKTQLTNNSVADFNPTFSPFGTAPQQVQLVLPVNGQTNCATTLDLSWNSVPNVTAYQLQLSTDQNFNSLAFDDATITATTKNLSSLQNNRNYFWRVRGVNQFGNGAWSITFNFTTIVALPNQVTLVTPQNNSILNQVNVAFSWNQADPQVDKYWFEIADNASMTNSQSDQALTVTQKTLSVAENKSYWWRVKGHNAAGWGPFSDIWKFTITITSVDNEILPTETKLLQNFPNPFNPETVISWRLASSSFVSLKIFDLLGKEVEILINEIQQAGVYSVKWRPQNLSSCVYFYHLVTDGYSNFKKMIYLK